MKILKGRNNLHFKALLCGKISLDDYHRESIYSIINFEGVQYPPFMEDMQEYLRCLEIIGQVNHIEADDNDDVSLNRFDEVTP